MIKEIITDEIILSKKSEALDLYTMTPRSYIVENLLDTATHHINNCLGLPARTIQHEIDHLNGVLI